MIHKAINPGVGMIRADGCARVTLRVLGRSYNYWIWDLVQIVKSNIVADIRE